MSTRKGMRLGGKLLALLFAICLLSSCEDNNCIKGEGDVETRLLELPPFTRIEANGDFKVYLLQGEEQQVEVKGEPNILDQLNTSISNSTWKIEHRDCVRKSKAVEVYITLPQVRSLYLNGSGRISSQSGFTANELAVEVNGSGKVEMEVTAAQVIARVTGSGEVALRGAAPRYNVNISGSGKATAFELQADDVTVNLSGSGVAEVNAAKTLTAAITGSGIVYYLGSPAVNTTISGSGKVIKK